MNLQMILVAACVLGIVGLVFYQLGRLMGLTMLAVRDAGPDGAIPVPSPARPIRSSRLSRPAFRPQPETAKPMATAGAGG
ncbi:hypothetical protein J0H58_23765 [bacterium]|nr:hypothetical protein [bacterium]